MADIVFWQRIVSPHMAGLVRELARRGHNITYVAERPMSVARASMGWGAPDVAPANLEFAPDAATMCALLESMPRDAVHICQGLRGNGPIRAVQQVLAARRLRHWVIMETVDDVGGAGLAKRWLYKALLKKFLKTGEGILAIGGGMPSWLTARGVPEAKIVPFAYFLPEAVTAVAAAEVPVRPFRIAFVGQLIELKRVSDILTALEYLKNAAPPPELWIIGDGPDASSLQKLGAQLLPERIHWWGMLPLRRVPEVISQVDLLILPSRHDGWGAVISEALMLGTPVICSDRCGAAVAVKASGVGGVYPMGNIEALTNLIFTTFQKGQITHERRSALRDWASVLGSVCGAAYLDDVIQSYEQKTSPPPPPWI